MAAIAASVPVFALIPDRRKTVHGERERFFADLAGGFREAWRTPILRALLVRAMGAYLLLGMAITLEALYVREVLDRGQDFLGVIFSVTGAGAALGSLALVALKHGVGREHLLLALGLFGGGFGYVLYVATSSPVICLLGTFLFGAGFTFFFSPSHALVRRVAPRPGKVTAVYAMLGEGGPLVAALLVAALGGLITVQPWLIGSAVLFTLLGLGSLPGSRRRGRDDPAAAPAEEPVRPA
jgi:hypothetical protein